MEVRHCYQTGDSKRTQADEAMARHLLVSGILPIMPLFCNQSNPGIIQRYRSYGSLSKAWKATTWCASCRATISSISCNGKRRIFENRFCDLLRSLTGMTQQTLFDMAPRFVNRSTKAVTFQGKLSLPIHRWYRLTPSFSPTLARDIAREFRLNGSDFVLDPFSGVGTVPLCMKYSGIPSCSVEINPYLQFVGTVKTRTYNDLKAIEDVFCDFSLAAEGELSGLPATGHAESYLADNAAIHSKPPQHSPLVVAGEFDATCMPAQVAPGIPNGAGVLRFVENGIARYSDFRQQRKA